MKTVAGIKAVCAAYEEIRGHLESAVTYNDFCLKDSKSINCCGPRSLGHYIAAFTGKACVALSAGDPEITQTDVDNYLEVVSKCAKEHDKLNSTGGLTAECQYNENCPEVTLTNGDVVPCRLDGENTIYDTIALLLPAQSVSIGGVIGTIDKLDMAMPFNNDIGESFYDTLKGDFFTTMQEKVSDGIDSWTVPATGQSYSGAALSSYKIGNLKGKMFSSQLMADSAFAALSVLTVVVVMIIHTGSSFIALLAMFQIILSFAVTFTMYMLLRVFARVLIIAPLCACVCTQCTTQT